MRVRGVGPVPCTTTIVGPYPGYEEDRTGVPFSGRSGQELERLLDGANLPDRKNFYITNLHKEYRGRDYVYSTEDTDSAFPLLLRELGKVKPSTIVTLGREVTRLFLGDVDITDVEGIPWHIKSGQTVYPLVHPAAGMRNSELSPYVVRGFQALATFLGGEVEPRILFDDPYQEPDYRLLAGEEVWQMLGKY